MKKLLTGLLLIGSVSAFANNIGQALCMKAVLDNTTGISVKMALDTCRNTDKGAALCLQAVLDNRAEKPYAHIINEQNFCRGVLEPQAICMSAILSNYVSTDAEAKEYCKLGLGLSSQN